VADDHARLRAALREVLPGAFVQRCYVHFLRNTLAAKPHEPARQSHGRHAFTELDALNLKVRKLTDRNPIRGGMT
jgi:transposase-like protein